MLEALFRTQSADGAHNPAERFGKQALEQSPVAGGGFLADFRPDGIVNDNNALGRHSPPANFDSLGLRHGHNAIHPAQNYAVECLVDAHLDRRAGPAVGNGNDMYAGTSCGPPAQQVGLVTVTA